jgi:hypothetical protein
MAVVHSHRHNKEETSEVLAASAADDQANVDFSLVRDTMYKYSKNA